MATYLKHKLAPYQHVPGPASGKEYWEQQDRHLVAYHKGKRAAEQVAYFRIERRYIQKTVRFTRDVSEVEMASLRVQVPLPVALPDIFSRLASLIWRTGMTISCASTRQQADRSNTDTRR